MKDYSDLGYNNRLQRVSSIPATRVPETQGLDFDSNYEIQGRKMRVSSLVQNSGIATASGSINDGASVSVTLTYRNSDQGKVFVTPYLAVYTGTAAVQANQIFPDHGANIANGKYVITSGFDWDGWNGTNSTYLITIENNSGTSTNIYAVGQHKKLAFRGEKEELS